MALVADVSSTAGTPPTGDTPFAGNTTSATNTTSAAADLTTAKNSHISSAVTTSAYKSSSTTNADSIAGMACRRCKRKEALNVFDCGHALCNGCLVAKLRKLVYTDPQPPVFEKLTTCCGDPVTIPELAAIPQLAAAPRMLLRKYRGLIYDDLAKRNKERHERHRRRRMAGYNY